MNPEKQRIAIAEACGWTNVRHTTMFKGQPGVRGLVSIIGTFGTSPSGEKDAFVPDYLNDLNAMHEAEKTMVGMDLWRYTQELWKVIQRNPFANYHIEKHVCATAAQRAEAFLKTIGKWEES